MRSWPVADPRELAKARRPIMARENANQSVSALAAEAAGRLERAGLSRDGARVDAGVLCRHVLGWDAATWLTHGADPVPPDARAAIEAAIERRARRVPVSQIVGTREFYGRAFAVTPEVLTPRPETELVVTQALAALDRAAARGVAAPRVLDIGTGTGCLAITIAAERPTCSVTATDISAAALRVARRNAAALGVSDRVTFAIADLVPARMSAFDLIVSNPPYVAVRDQSSLAPEVRDHEPPVALFGGPDGLDVIRRLAPAAVSALAPGGTLIIEIGAGHATAVRGLLAASGIRNLGTARDLQGIERVVVGGSRRDSEGL